MPDSYSIVMFDGECAFCDKAVRWIIAHDPRGRLRFVARQSPLGQKMLAEHGLPPEGLESMILFAGPRVFTHSSAVLGVAGRLPFPWKLGGLFRIVPPAIRNLLYSAIARRRYRIAGKVGQCSLPSPEQRRRILSEAIS